MSRTARSYQVIAQQPHHIWFRGNNQRRLFSYLHEYRTFLFFLKEAMRKTNVQLHAFSLLSNHGHLLVTPPSVQALSQCMQRTLHRYALHRNKRRKASGKLFEERFACKPIHSDAYLAIVHAYIDLNPKRAGLESNIGDYPWSSTWIHLCENHARLTWLAELCTPIGWYTNLGKTPAERSASYRHWLDECLEHERFAELDRIPLVAVQTTTERRPSGTAVTR